MLLFVTLALAADPQEPECPSAEVWLGIDATEVAEVVERPGRLRLLLDGRAFPADPEERAAERVKRAEGVARIKGIVAASCHYGRQGELLLGLANNLRGYGELLVLDGDATGIDPLTRSVKLYRQLQQTRPGWRAEDLAYHLGRAQLSAGRTFEGLDTLVEFVKTWPDSPNTPDAYTRIGDVWFSRCDTYKSLTAFQRAEAAKDPATWAYARYMLDWAWFNVGETDKAIEGHRALLTLPVHDAFDKALREEALADLQRFLGG